MRHSPCRRPRLYRIVAAALLLGALFVLPGRVSAQATDPADLAFWQSIQNSTNPAEYKAYLDAFPNGRFANLARIRAGGAAGGGAAPAAKPAAPALPAGAIDAAVFAKEAMDIKRPGLFAKYRGKTLTLSGRFKRFIDTGIGDRVWAEFDPGSNAPGTYFKVSCEFERSKTKLYDTFATMKAGTPLTISGAVFDANDVFNSVIIKPCAVLDPPLDKRAAAPAGRDGPLEPPAGTYVCTVFGGADIGALRLVDKKNFYDIDGKKRPYAFDRSSGRITFPKGTLGGEKYVGRYEQPGAPSTGARYSHPAISIAPAEKPNDPTVLCNLRK